MDALAPQADTRSRAVWSLAAVALILLTALGLRYGTNILDISTRYDERFALRPISDLLEHGWSAEYALDFQETKGPGYIWPYALLGELLGSELNRLRLISVIFFTATVVPLLLILRWTRVDGPSVLAATCFLILVPHNAVHAQMVMSEPSFVFGSMLLMLIFMWGFGHNPEDQHRVAAPILFAVVLSILLHARVHAVAYAGAACLVAFERDRLRSWPWWLACIIAGLSRIPLWVRWGGLVSPDHQIEHTVGVSPESLTYLAAAMVPFLIVFLWPALREGSDRRRLLLLAAAAGFGLLLGLLASPSLEITATNQFQGFAATFTKKVAVLPIVRDIGSLEQRHTVAIAALACVGAASLAALGVVSWRRPVSDPLGVAARLATWSFFVGWMMYGLARAFVFDRYFLSWSVLLPLCWAKLLPRWLAWLQGLGLAAIGAYLVWVWLFVDSTHLHPPTIEYLSDSIEASDPGP